MEESDRWWRGVEGSDRWGRGVVAREKKNDRRGSGVVSGVAERSLLVAGIAGGGERSLVEGSGPR